MNIPEEQKRAIFKTLMMQFMEELEATVVMKEAKDDDDDGDDLDMDNYKTRNSTAGK